MIRAVIFDLDDTLYEERQFFRSGFNAVAEFLAKRGIGPASDVVQALEHFHHQEGREQVFQKLAVRMGFPPEWIQEMVSVFRQHRPAIHLCEDARTVLPRLRQRFRLGCVTDGWAAVQRAKLAALGVAPPLDAVDVAADFGRPFWKPHPLPFQKCCVALGVPPEEAVFVGDNPERDLAGARSAGMLAIRMRRAGSYFEFRATGSPAAAIAEVRDLFQLEEVLAPRRALATGGAKCAVRV